MEEEVVKTLDLSCGIGGGYGGRLVESGVDGVLVVTVRALVFEEVVVFCQDGRFCEYRKGIGGARDVWGLGFGVAWLFIFVISFSLAFDIR